MEARPRLRRLRPEVGDVVAAADFQSDVVLSGAQANLARRLPRGQPHPGFALTKKPRRQDHDTGLDNVTPIGGGGRGKRTARAPRLRPTSAVQDREWGPAFIKIGSYLPYAVRVCLNAHEWAKQQARRQGLAFDSLDNGFGWCADPTRLQRICDRLGTTDVQRFFDRWTRRLP
jgi:hypothetical protein